jgi:penicillin G amidase
LNLRDVPRGGDGTTPNATGYGARQTAGASFREVIDVADWDRSMTINVPGASGQPASSHYDDLLPLWAEGRYHPLPYSRAAVDASAAARLVLRPAGSPITR